MQFKAGDKIVALTSKECKINPRVKGKTYTVIASTSCPKCNNELVCIKEGNKDDVFKQVCSGCESAEIRSNMLWTDAKHFAHTEESLEVQLELAVKEENYELAAILRDKILSKITLDL